MSKEGNKSILRILLKYKIVDHSSLLSFLSFDVPLKENKDFDEEICCYRCTDFCSVCKMRN